MKLKIFTTLCLFAVASITQAANVSIEDIDHLPGNPDLVQVPILISPEGAEMVSGMDISFSVGEAADLIPIVDADPSRPVDPMNPLFDPPEEFDGSIWAAPNGGFLGTPNLGSFHNVSSTVSRLSSPLQISPDGTVITYTLDLEGVAPGSYVLNANYLDGTNAFVLDGQDIDPVALTFSTGTLHVAVPEPSTVVMTALFAVMGLGVYFKRRRG